MMLNVRDGQFTLCLPGGEQKVVAGNVLTGMGPDEIQLINDNMTYWTGLFHAFKKGNDERQIWHNLVRVIIVARGDLLARAKPRALDGSVLPPVGDATIVEVEQREIHELTDVLYECVSQHAEATNAAS